MEWVGRRAFERGYRRSGEEKNKEVEVLDASEGSEVTDGTLEDEDDVDNSPSNEGSGEITKRWTGVIRCAVGMAQAVGGLTWVDGIKDRKIEGILAPMVLKWTKQDCHHLTAETHRPREDHQRTELNPYLRQPYCYGRSME